MNIEAVHHHARKAREEEDPIIANMHESMAENYEAYKSMGDIA